MNTEKTIEQELNAYSTHTFTNNGSTGLDYRQFESHYHKYLNKIAEEMNAKVIKFHPGHYEYSAFIKRNNSIVYISISDVRYSINEWRDNILVRKAAHDRDYSGRRNTYTNLTNLKSHINKLLNEKE